MNLLLLRPHPSDRGRVLCFFSRSGITVDTGPNQSNRQEDSEHQILLPLKSKPVVLLSCLLEDGGGSGGGSVVGLSMCGLMRSICRSISEGSKVPTYLQPFLQIHSSHKADSAANSGGFNSGVKLASPGVLFFSRRSFWKSGPHAGGLAVEEVVAGWPLPLCAVGGVKSHFAFFFRNFYLFILIYYH